MRILFVDSDGVIAAQIKNCCELTMSKYLVWFNISTSKHPIVPIIWLAETYFTWDINMITNYITAIICIFHFYKIIIPCNYMIYSFSLRVGVGI